MISSRITTTQYIKARRATIENLIAYSPAVALIVSSVVAVIIQFQQTKRLEKQLRAAHVVVKDSHDLRTLLKKPFEGQWSLRGEFSKFQGTETPHSTSGYVILTWNHAQGYYDAIYIYVVRGEHAENPCVAALCTGKAVESTDARKNQLTFQLKVESRVSDQPSTSSSLIFSLIGRVKRRDIDGPRRLEAPYATAKTIGTIVMER